MLRGGITLALYSGVVRIVEGLELHLNSSIYRLTNNTGKETTINTWHLCNAYKNDDMTF